MESVQIRVSRFVTTVAAFALVAAVPVAHATPASPSGGVPQAYDDVGDAVAISGKTAVIGADGVNNGAGAAYVYVRSQNGWQLQAALADPGDAPNDQFGSAVALDGSTLLIGAVGTNDFFGAIYAYTRSGTRWVRQQTLTAPGASFFDDFGYSIALSGSTAVLGAYGMNKNAGTAYVYFRSVSRWHLGSTLPDPAGKANDYFGGTVAISGSTAMIAGAADIYVYVRSGSAWHQQETLSIPGGKGAYGSSIALSGATAIVGAAGEKNQNGAAYEYLKSGSNWRLGSTFHDPYHSFQDFFGGSDSLSGNSLLIGAGDAGHYENGVAFFYTRSAPGSAWRRRETIADPNGGAIGNGFADAVGLSGSIAIVGAMNVNNGAGAAYLYARSKSGWKLAFAATDAFGASGGLTGWSEAIDGRLAVVGAPGKTGGAGVAYVYGRSGSNWRRQTVLTDPGKVEGNPYGDAFGDAVAVFGRTVLVGAPGSGNNGAAYIYARPGRRWRKQATLEVHARYNADLFGSAVALSGSTAVIGAYLTGGGVGAVTIYQRSGSRWRRQASLSVPANYGDVPQQEFGESVAISGGTMIVGAPGTGDAYIYTRTGTQWHRQASLTPPPGYVYADNYGISVAISGSTAIVGADGANDNAGLAYVYTRLGGKWVLDATLKNQKGVPGSGYGYSVAASGTGNAARLLVGGLSVSGLPTGTTQCGHVFEYIRSGRGWREGARLADPQCHSYDEYGFAVAISDGNAVIGAPGANRNSGASYVAAVP